MKTKKIILFVLFLGIIVIAAVLLFSKQKTTAYTLTGNIKGLQCVAGKSKGMSYTKDYIYLYGPVKNGKQELDSAKVVNGRFTLEGTTDEPIRATLICMPENSSHPAILQFFIENSDIHITGKYAAADYGSPFEDIKVSGSATEDEYKKLIAGADEFSGRSKLQEEYRKASEKNDTGSFAALQEKLRESYDKNAEYLREYYDSHPQSYIRLYSLGNSIPGDEQGINNLEKQLKEMDTVMQSSFTAKQILSSIEEKRKGMAIGPGRIAIDFVQPDIDGNSVKLSDYKGKYVLLDFWASWCAPCRAENPNVLKAYNKYHKKGLEVLSVSLDTDREAWLKAVKQDGLPWKQVSELKGFKSEAALKYVILSIPTTFLINPEGIIVAKNLRGEVLEENLKEIFK